MNRNWSNLPKFSQALYKDTYFLPNETYDKWLDRVSTAYQNDEEHGKRMKSYIQNLWFHPSTPISSNAGTSSGLPISCFTGKVFDSKTSIFNSYNESNWLGAMGGGLGWDWSAVRSVNEPVGTDGDVSSGVIPFLGVSDRSTLAVSQGGKRRASQAVYLDISHPEIEEFIDIRKETGDANRRCHNLHHGVVITDDFMNAIIQNNDWNLVSPKTNETIKTIPARKLWTQLLEARVTTGEPYLLFKDTVNRLAPDEYKNENIEVTTSNLCVTGDTKILTKDYGYIPIEHLENKTVECWNGTEWSLTPVFKTSEGQAVVTVTLSNQVEIEATPYHKWYVMDSYSKIVEKRTYELQPGDKLIQFELEPIQHGNHILPLAYVNGFHSGDVTVYEKSNKLRISLHDNKQLLLNRFSGYYSSSYTNNGRILNLNYTADVLKDKFYVPDNSINIEDRLLWLAGYIDADGTLTNNQGTESIQLSSTEITFLKEVMLLLQEIGIHSTISKAKNAGYKKLPTNNGYGSYKYYWAKDLYHLLIPSSEFNKLIDLGFNSSRVIPTNRSYQQQARQYVQVVSVTDKGNIAPTYCGTEPKRNKLMFNGVLTGNCSEITLRTDEKHSGVCCLGSINLEYWDEYQDCFDEFIADCCDYLDNVLQDFINKTEGLPGFERARNGAIDERSIGLGVMGFHSLLQSKMIPWESAIAKGLNLKIFKQIKESTDYHNTHTNYRCPMSNRCPDEFGYKRNIHVTAVAPTMSISALAGVTSSGIEPWISNAFTKKVKQGSFTIKNKHLETLINDYAKNNSLNDTWIAEQWKNIVTSEGSVQQLTWMADNQKEVFKTAFEIDQRYILELASDRASLIDQAQSINIFIPAGSGVQYISDLHILAWKRNIKSLYYLRSTAGVSATTVSGERKQIVIEPEECLSCQ